MLRLLHVCKYRWWWLSWNAFSRVWLVVHMDLVLVHCIRAHLRCVTEDVTSIFYSPSLYICLRLLCGSTVQGWNLSCMDSYHTPHREKHHYILAQTPALFSLCSFCLCLQVSGRIQNYPASNFCCKCNFSNVCMDQSCMGFIESGVKILWKVLETGVPGEPVH